MKKILTLLMAALLCLPCAFSLAEEAGEVERETFTCGDFEYALLEDGTAKITQYHGKATTLDIPSELNGYTVSVIGERSFYFSNIVSINIPDCVISINNEAFLCSFDLISICIPFGVTTIGNRAFSDCYALSYISLPNSITTIGDAAFNNCDSITSFTFPDSITSIGSNPFTDCALLTEIIVSPDHPLLSVIDHVLFCKGDKRLVCYPCSLAVVTEAVEEAADAMEEADDWKESSKDEGGTYLQASDTYSIPQGTKTIGDYAFCGCSSLCSIVIPDSITTIGNQAFYRCDSLYSIIIPEGTTTIGDKAFDLCRNLYSVILPDSIDDIGINPFSGCRNLTRISVSPDHPLLAMIDGVLFSKSDKRLVTYPCSNTTLEYSIPQGVYVIGDHAFTACYSLASITIPDSVNLIGDSAFFGCSSLTSITLPDNVTAIGKEAFCDCSSLTSVIMPDSISYIGERAFYWSGIQIVTVGHDSYAKQYCIDNNLPYTYADANDWLNN